MSSAEYKEYFKECQLPVDVPHWLP